MRLFGVSCFLLAADLLASDDAPENPGELRAPGAPGILDPTQPKCGLNGAPGNYFTVALIACSHLVPVVLKVRTAKRWVPVATVRVVFSAVLLVSAYFFTPSIQTSIRLN